jgi:hypothetical protein
MQKLTVTQEHNMWALENSVIHVGRGAQSLWMTDFFDLSTVDGIVRHLHVVLLRHARLFNSAWSIQCQKFKEKNHNTVT